MSNSIDVCLSPKLIDLYDLEGKIVVVVDILRATSVMTTALAHGAKEIIPVEKLEVAKEYLTKEGYLCAAERGGEQIAGFPLDNSPFNYMKDNIKGASIVITTTNGTVAIEKSAVADQILVGSFLNLTSVAEYIKTQNKDVVVHCAGWKGKTNMEDTLYAGALIERLQSTHALGCDTPHMALKYWEAVKNDLQQTVADSAHAKRLNKLNITKDIRFCTQIDEYDVVPKMEGTSLVAVK
ncbi:MULTISPECIES: 2-phosphosulfolactate phosphatase [Reichenbachiella]|uniref:Probable 2-phosphosulfolactate phosphatase n=1 Tax=Reichenbachiella agariperforans TaxID=156994 RepID=A0A1M6N9A8_REIAG|nr:MULTISPECIES: 2-phosphosulfolactate phosphatase [Reichenbachiella]RJE71951.1 2-phosphosulfolactate phosphatase [Reichenbachiella sp. MSK19-1]SHJ92320.1 2-phosphosulfolactate phosphatase [Reichenbachiella agariperforans]